VFDYKRRKAGRLRGASLMRGKHVQFNVITRFLLNGGAEERAARQVPMLRSFDEYRQIIIAPFIRAPLCAGSEQVCGYRIGAA
jgi:hypothetical protein